MSGINKYKIYSKGHLRRLARLEAESYSHNRRLLQAQQTSSCSNINSSLSSINIEYNEEIIAKKNIDNSNITYISQNKDNEEDDILESNLIQCDNVILSSVKTINKDDINFYSKISNKSSNENVDKNFKTITIWTIKFGITHSALTALFDNVTLRRH